MNGNRFSIFSGWDPRPETPATMGKRMLENLEALSHISPYFDNWQFLDRSLDPMEMTEENQHEYVIPFEDAHTRMTQLFEIGVRRNDFREPDPAGGYSATASNDQPDDTRHVSLMAWGGGRLDPRAGLRMAEFQTAYDMFPDPAIVTYPIFKAALLSVVSSWDVRHAQAYSDELRQHWGQPHKLFLDLAWMTYMSPELAAGYVPPDDVLVEPVEGGGMLLIAAQDTFDTANEDHMDAAKSIVVSLSRINTAEEAKWNYIRSVPPPRPLRR